MSSTKKFDRRKTFIIYRNRNKHQPKHPDFVGQLVDENGNNYNISGWVNKNGSISGRFELHSEVVNMMLRKKTEEGNLQPTDVIDPDAPKEKKRRRKKKEENEQKPADKDARDLGLPNF